MEVSKSCVAADVGTDRKMKKEEDGGRPAMKTRGSKRNTEEGGLSCNGLQSSSEPGREKDVPDVVSCCPDLVQDKIFELLSLRDKVRVAQVCSSWRDAVYKPPHWKGSIVNVKVSKQTMSSLQARQIKRLELVAPCIELKKVLVEFSTLEYLFLSPRNTANLLNSVTTNERFVSMKKLYLHTERKLQMQSLKRCLTCFPNLEVLSVVGVVTTSLLATIGKQLKGLVSMRLMNTRNYPRLNVEAVGQLKSLRYLQLEDFQLEGIEGLSQLSSTLSDLEIKRCDIAGGEFTPVLSQLSSLIVLEMMDCLPVIDAEGLRLLAQSLPNLEMFSCGACSTSRFEIPIESGLTDDHVGAVAEMAGLQELDLEHGTMLTDTGFLRLCSGLRNLKSLTLCNCFGITTRGIEHISGLSSLTELELQDSEDGDTWLKTLAQGSCKLRRLKLFAFAISAEGMRNLAKMSTLCELSLKNMEMRLTDIAHLNKAGFHLQSLEIMNSGVTVEALTPLLKRQTSLRRLILVERTGTPSSQVPHLKAILPHLEKLSVFNWNHKKFWSGRLSDKIYPN